MNLFISGCNSFVGRELIRQCDERNINIVGVDLLPSERSDCHVADVTSPDIGNLIPSKVDAIIHLAGLTRDPDCRDRAKDCFQANVMATLNLIDAAQEKAARQFIFASSEWVYDVFEEGVAKVEESPINAEKLTSEYALSKYVSEVNLRQKFQHGFCPVTILRFGIIYGPRAENWSAVEALLNTVASKDEITVGALATGRNFIHVSDIASGILASIGLPGFEILNLQGDSLVTLKDVLETSQSLLGREIKISESNPDAPSIRFVDNSKAKKLLKWEPKISLSAGLKSVAEHLGHLHS
jgi:nucleoside-diphosphate-sugar epimerase